MAAQVVFESLLGRPNLGRTVMEKEDRNNKKVRRLVIVDREV